MANLSDVAKNKLAQLKGLLGEKTVEKVVADAEAREKAAESVGLDFKEKSGEPQKLSHILAQVDTALEDGSIVDDLTTESDEKTPAPAAQAPAIDTKELAKEIAAAINTATKESLKTEFKEFLAALETKEAAKPDDPKVVEVQTKLKATETEQTKLKAQLEELLGSQPKNAAGFKASQANETLLKEEDLKNRSTGPTADPLNAFVSDFVMGNHPAANGGQP